MDESQHLLELIEEAVVGHGGDLGGWTKLDDGALQVFDGRVTLRASLKENDPGSHSLVIHAHVLATLHEHDDEVLDACLVALNEDREAGLKELAGIWLVCVAGPIRSFLDDRPVCMTTRSGRVGGEPSAGDIEADFGMPGMTAFVGPAFLRFFDEEEAGPAIDASQPWFRYAPESAAPRRVHLAKATVSSQAEKGWRRELEIDGHDVSHKDPDWPAPVRAGKFGLATRFAVFAFPPDTPELARRAELERAILHFAGRYGTAESIDDLKAEMVGQGFDPEVVHEVESISTLAFSRNLFEPMGVGFSPTIIRARRDGRIETDVPLMSIPAYNRARAIAARLRETMPEDAFQALCFYNAEGQVLLKAMESIGDANDLSRLKLYPCIVPDPGVSDATMDAALATLEAMSARVRAEAPPQKKKPWWKFW